MQNKRNFLNAFQAMSMISGARPSLEETPQTRFSECLPSNVNGFRGAAQPGRDPTNTIF